MCITNKDELILRFKYNGNVTQTMYNGYLHLNIIYIIIL